MKCFMEQIKRPLTIIVLLIILLSTACAQAPQPLITGTATERPASTSTRTSTSTPTASSTPTETKTPTPTSTFTPAPTSTQTPITYEPGDCVDLGFKDAMYEQYTCYLIDPKPDYKVIGAISNDIPAFMVFYSPDPSDLIWQEIEDFLRFAARTKNQDLSEMEHAFDDYESGNLSPQPNTTVESKYGNLNIAIVQIWLGESNIVWLVMRYMP